MKLPFLFLSAWLLTIAANGQQGRHSRTLQDSTQELYPVQSIAYRGSMDENRKRQLVFILRAGSSSRMPMSVYAVHVDSVKLISAKDTIALLNPKADTTCIDPVSFILQNGYCDWRFSFSLQDKDSEFLLKSEVETVLFFDRIKIRRDELTGSRRKIIQDAVKE